MKFCTSGKDIAATDSPVWWKMWARSWDACMKLLPQNWQLWGFTPVCVLTWRFSVSFAANLARHWNQAQEDSVTINCQRRQQNYMGGSILLHIQIQKLAGVSVIKHNLQMSQHRFAVLFESCSQIPSAYLSYWCSIPSWLPTSHSSNKKWQTE